MNLPIGWAWYRLDEVAHARLGKMLDKAKNSGPEREYLRNVNVRWFGFDLTDVQLMRVSDADAADLDIRNGDVLICEGGEPGRSAVWALGDRQMTFQKALHRVRTGPALLPHWLVWHLKLASVTGELSQSFTGSTIKHFPLVALNAYRVPVPPPSEQRRIADKLETLLARVDSVNDRLARVAPLLKRFRQSVLAAATSGKLTEEWRAMEEAHAVWTATPLGELIEEMRNGLSAKPDEDPSGSRILRISAVRPCELDLTDHRYLKTDRNDAQLYSICPGDLLFTRYNGSLDFVGVCALVRDKAPGYVYPDKLIRVRVRLDRVLPAFVELASSAPRARAQIEGFIKSSAGQKGISGGDLKRMEILVPSLSEQTEVVRRAGLLLAYADRLEARLQTAQTAAERLTPALLAKAFRGELVTQDPNDEPASELLKRLAAQRAQAGTPSARPRGRKPAALAS